MYSLWLQNLLQLKPCYIWYGIVTRIRAQIYGIIDIRGYVVSNIYDGMPMHAREILADKNLKILAVEPPVEVMTKQDSKDTKQHSYRKDRHNLVHVSYEQYTEFSVV